MNESLYKTEIAFGHSTDVLNAGGQAGYEVLAKVNGEDFVVPKLKDDVCKFTIEAPLGAVVDLCIFPVNKDGVSGPGRAIRFRVRDVVPPAMVGEPKVMRVIKPLPVMQTVDVDALAEKIEGQPKIEVYGGYDGLPDPAYGELLGWDTQARAVIARFGLRQLLLKPQDTKLSHAVVYPNLTRISLGEFVEKQYGVPEAQQIDIPTGA